jgi:ADP-dependent NAD(P)H-hydrate dehydratase / NAD(P)H-hydrate epimerase
MKILNTQQIRDTDKYTIENEPIASIDLMERASKAFFDQVKKRLKKQDKIIIFCGMGNNGGDGLAVARMLINSGYDVSVYKIIHSDKSSPDFALNEERLKKLRKANFTEVSHITELPLISEKDIVIDALFGSGLTRPLEGFPAEVVRHINKSKARVIAIDLPSGLFGEDNTDNISENIIRADYTFTFQLPKLSFMFPENDVYLGQWQVLDIGLNQDFINRQDTPYHFLLKEDLVPFYKYRRKFDHKGNFGHALLIAGSYGKSGAAVLAGKAALKTGAGLLTTHVPAANYVIQQTSIPEGMVSIDENEKFFSGIRNPENWTAIGIGPGLDKDPATQNALKLIIQNVSQPMVLDADALNILAENPTWLSFLPPGSILTPHVGEFERLAGKCINGWERLEKARDFAFRFRCYVVLKGAHTAVITPDKQVLFNSTGNPGMATGGSGDVLTGMILGLLAQGYSPQYSSVAAVFLHGLSADLAVRRKPAESLLAGDIINFIERAILRVYY